MNTQEKIRHGSKRVLIVEDEPAARQATQRYLQFCGYEVETAGDAERALQLALQFKPQVLICDCNLGDRDDGIDVAREIQKQFGSAVIFVTAYTYKDLRTQFNGIEVKDCLRKPVTLGRLAEVISSESAE